MNNNQSNQVVSRYALEVGYKLGKVQKYNSQTVAERIKTYFPEYKDLSIQVVELQLAGYIAFLDMRDQENRITAQ